MESDRQKEAEIISAWRDNAPAWRTAVRERRIRSRRTVTDQAIIDAVMEYAPASVLDLGCGEGWLCRALMDRTASVIGVDGSSELIGSARDAAAGDYRVLDYERICRGELELAVDVVVSNFALLGKDSVAALIQAVPQLLKPRGHFVVQTLHPFTACGDAAYRDGWRDGSWTGCGDGFGDPAPWYFRTLESWIGLFDNAGFRLRKLSEPLSPDSGRPLSVIFVAERA